MKDTRKSVKNITKSIKPEVICVYQNGWVELSKYSITDFANAILVSDDEKARLRKKYNDYLNEGRLHCSFELYLDIEIDCELKNIRSSIPSANVEEKEKFDKIIADFNAAFNEKTYLKNLKNENECISFLTDQGFIIENQIQDRESVAKYLIHLPDNRISTIEDEARAMNQLSARPVIVNVEKRMFLILKESEV